MVLRKIKKIVSAVIALTMAASLCCISVGASDLEAGNSSVGRGNFNLPGTATSNFDISDNYENGDNSLRTEIELKAKNDTVNSATGFLQANQGINVTGFAFVHHRFRFSATNAWQIRMRKNSDGGNAQWMNFNSDGSISPNGSYPEWEELDTEWNVSPDSEHWVENTLDLILSPNAVYMYINGELASYTARTNFDKEYRGFLLYTNTKWYKADGDGFRWRYDSTLGSNGFGNAYTKYVDTETHSVTFEEVLADKGLAPTYSDSNLLFANDDIADYIHNKGPQDEEGNYLLPFIYPAKDSVRIQGDYYGGTTSSGQAKNFMNFFRTQNGVGGRGLGYLRETKIGGAVLHMSFNFMVNKGNRAEIRLCANDENQNNNRFTFTPDDGKIRVSSFSKTAITLDKIWGTDSVNVGIIVDRVNRKAYSIVEGKVLGGAFDFSSVGDFNDLKVYLNGTSDEDTIADVTISNWSLKEYYSSKDINGLIAELEGMPVYFAENGNSIETEDQQLGMAVTANTTFGAEVASGKMYAAVYDGDGKLTDIQRWDYDAGETNESIVFDLTGDETTVKVFCLTPGFEGLAKPVAYTIEQPAASEE